VPGQWAEVTAQVMEPGQQVQPGSGQQPRAQGTASRPQCVEPGACTGRTLLKGEANGQQPSLQLSPGQTSQHSQGTSMSAQQQA
jgi:hypothetical protein